MRKTLWTPTPLWISALAWLLMPLIATAAYPLFYGYVQSPGGISTDAASVPSHGLAFGVNSPADQLQGSNGSNSCGGVTDTLFGFNRVGSATKFTGNTTGDIGACGSSISHTGNFKTDNTTLQLCPSGTCGGWQLVTDSNPADTDETILGSLSVAGTVVQTVGSVSFTGGASQAFAVTEPGNVDIKATASANATFESANGNVNLTTSGGSVVVSAPTGHLTVNPDLRLTGPLNQTAANSFAGACTMSSGTTCTRALAVAPGSPICIVTDQNSGTAIAGDCSISGTTATVKAGTSNSDVWGIWVFGNPN